MKIFLTKDKFLDIDLTNWMKSKSDPELNILQQLFADFVHTTGEMLVYDIEKGRYSMLPIVSNDFAFKQAIKEFGHHYGLDVEVEQLNKSFDLDELTNTIFV